MLHTVGRWRKVLLVSRPSILFLCTGNSCRSQMAEGFARALVADRLDAHSAGTSPHGLNRLAVRAMAEVGIDISKHTSKTPADLEALGIVFDFVFTVCDSARETCPIWPARTRLIHHSFDDPPRLAREMNGGKGPASHDEAMPHYRRVRDEIRTVVVGLPEWLGTRQ